MKYLIYYSIALIYNIVTIHTEIDAYRNGEFEPILFSFKKRYKDKFINIISRAAFFLSICFIKPTISRWVYIVIGFFPIVLTVTILNLKCYAKIKVKRILNNTLIFDLIWISYAIITFMQLLN